MPILALEFETPEQEASWVATEIKKKIDNGTKPEEIAVIARKNSDLSFVGGYLRAQNISFSHEKAQNLLTEALISQVLMFLIFIESLNKVETKNREDLLPNILFLPVWQNSPSKIFELSLLAKKEHKSWLEIMKTNQELGFSTIYGFFNVLSQKAKTETALAVFEALLGFKPVEIEIETQIEVDTEVFLDNNLNSKPSQKTTENDSKNFSYTSPFKNWLNDQGAGAYCEFLWQLKKLITEIVGDKKDMNLSSFLDIAAQYQLNNLAITASLPVETNKIHLLSAHKAKGLEFEKVFILDCSKTGWGSNKNTNTIKLPANLPLEPAKDNTDDFLRLLFVAITRAKDDLFLTTSSGSKNSKNPENSESSWAPSLQTAFENLSIEVQKPVLELSPEIILPSIFESQYDFKSALENNQQDHKLDLLLNSTLKRYKISASDLTSFLDITRSGPLGILEKRLLRFPSPSSISQAVGNLVHDILFELYILWGEDKITLTQKIPNQSENQSENQLENQSENQGLGPAQNSKIVAIQLLQAKILKLAFNQKDKDRIYFKSKFYLELYLSQLAPNWQKGGVVEKDFGKENPVLVAELFEFGQPITLPAYFEVPATSATPDTAYDTTFNIPLAGKIDRLDFDFVNKTITIVDYKTGNPFSSWNPKSGKTQNQKTDIWKYKLQLIFYKILIEASGLYPEFNVIGAKLEFLKPQTIDYLNHGVGDEIVNQDQSNLENTKQNKAENKAENKLQVLHLDFENEQIIQEVERAKKLIKAVYLKIINKDFENPETSSSLKSFKMIEQFENLLLGLNTDNLDMTIDENSKTDLQD